MKTIWEKLAEGVSTTAYMKGMDAHLNGEKFQTMQELTDVYREKVAIQLPIMAGTKVAFIGFLESYMSYENPPSNGMVGEVVSAKSANGDVTSHEGKVFVRFEDGVSRSIFAQHLQLAGCEKLKNEKMRKQCEKAKEEGVAKKALEDSFKVASLGDLTNFLKVADNTLIHTSSKDLWSFQKDADGNLTVERLYDDNGKPLKL